MTSPGENTSYADFNYASLRSVLECTREDERGIFIPGELMPMGRPVRADGVTRLQLMRGEAARSMTEQWTTAVKEEYERQEDERNQDSGAGSAGTPTVDWSNTEHPAERAGGGESDGGDDPPVPRPREPEAAPAPTGSSLEETLQASHARWQARLDALDEQIATLEAERREAISALRKTEAAITAILMADDDGD